VAQQYTRHGTIRTSYYTTHFEAESVNTIGVYDFSEMRLIYCDYNTRHHQIKFSGLWSPLRIQIWLSLIVFTGLSSIALTMIHCEREGSSLSAFERLKSFLNEIYFVYRILVCQELSAVSIFVVTLSHALAIITTLYRNEITSELIVRSEPTIMIDLKDILYSNYKVFFTSIYTSETQMKEETIHLKEKLLFNIPARYREEIEKTKHNFLEPISFKWSNLNRFLRKVGNSHEKMAMLPFFPSKAIRSFILASVKEYNLKNHHCNNVKKPVIDFFNHALFLNPMYERMVEMTRRFFELGLFPLWTRLESNRFQLHVGRNSLISYQDKDEMNSTIHHKEGVYASLPDLIPIFTVWATCIILCVIAFTIEKISKLSYLNYTTTTTEVISIRID
jgi:hypothetical protein